MAERRMFSCKVTSSDDFKMMSLPAQALYFQLGMEADDDGFVNNALSIARSIGAGQAEVEELIDNRFILRLTRKLVVIKHWRINNYIRTDRYTETAYARYKELIILKDNGSYTEKDKNDPYWKGLGGASEPLFSHPATDCQPSVNHPSTECRSSGDRTETQDRIGKDNNISYFQEQIPSIIPQDNNDISTYLPENTHSPAPAGEADPAQEISLGNSPTYSIIVGVYNSVCRSLPHVKYISEKRKKTIKARLNSGYSLESFRTLFTKAEASAFLKGANKRNWVADFDWLIKDANMAKVLDGKYDGGPDAAPRSDRSDISGEQLDIKGFSWGV